jgi:hypothetical protein
MNLQILTIKLYIYMRIFCSDTPNLFSLLSYLKYFNGLECVATRTLNSAHTAATECHKPFEHNGYQLYCINSITIFYQFPLFLSSRNFIIRFRKGWSHLHEAECGRQIFSYIVVKFPGKCWFHPPPFLDLDFQYYQPISESYCRCTAIVLRLRTRPAFTIIIIIIIIIIITIM